MTLTSNQKAAFASGDMMNATVYSALMADAQMFDAICEAAGSRGEYTGLQDMDDGLGSGYLAHVLPGSYNNLVIASNNNVIVFRGAEIGAVTISGNSNTLLFLGDRSTMTSLVISGDNNAVMSPGGRLRVANASATSDLVTVSGNYNQLIGRIDVELAGGGGLLHDCVSVSGQHNLLERVRVIDADNRGFELATGSDYSRVIDCVVVDADHHALVFTGEQSIVQGFIVIAAPGASAVNNTGGHNSIFSGGVIEGAGGSSYTTFANNCVVTNNRVDSGITDFGTNNQVQNNVNAAF